MNKSDSLVELTKSLVAFQSELKPVPKDSINPFFHSKYADISTIWETIRPLLFKHGFAVSQLPQEHDGKIILTTLLLHTSGEWLSSELLVVPDKPNNPQAVGSALTYARRYALSALLGICSEEDDDAEVAVNRKPIQQQKPAQAAPPSGKGAIPPVIPGTFTNLGSFLTACNKSLGLTRPQVLDKLGVKDFTGVNFTDAYNTLEQQDLHQ
jgi:hypothetical protein